jgi:hypothetical protein
MNYMVSAPFQGQASFQVRKNEIRMQKFRIWRRT